MNHRIECKWVEGMAFEAESGGHKIIMDAGEDLGGSNSGPTPKPLLLISLAGCTGIDILHILKKMHLQPEYFNLEVDGVLTETHPQYYKKITIRYFINGKDITFEKVEKAVKLSMESYCGVSALLGKGAEIGYEILLNANSDIK
jgi:putative redox protein